jgi:hypothetical protein
VLAPLPLPEKLLRGECVSPEREALPLALAQPLALKLGLGESVGAVLALARALCGALALPAPGVSLAPALAKVDAEGLPVALPVGVEKSEAEAQRLAEPLVTVVALAPGEGLSRLAEGVELGSDAEGAPVREPLSEGRAVVLGPDLEGGGDVLAEEVGDALREIDALPLPRGLRLCVPLAEPRPKDAVPRALLVGTEGVGRPLTVSALLIERSPLALPHSERVKEAAVDDEGETVDESDAEGKLLGVGLPVPQAEPLREALPHNDALAVVDAEDTALVVPLREGRDAVGIPLGEGNALPVGCFAVPLPPCDTDAVREGEAQGEALESLLALGTLLTVEANVMMVGSADAETLPLLLTLFVGEVDVDSEGVAESVGALVADNENTPEADF